MIVAPGSLYPASFRETALPWQDASPTTPLIIVGNVVFLPMRLLTYGGGGAPNYVSKQAEHALAGLGNYVVEARRHPHPGIVGILSAPCIVFEDAADVTLFQIACG